MDGRVVYPSQGDLEVAQRAAVTRYNATTERTAVATLWKRLGSQDPGVTLADLERLTAAGQPSAATLLGDVYQHGYFGHAKSRDNAAKWYGFAAEQGDTAAMLRLADHHHADGGRTAPRDFGQILHWLERADACGSANGSLHLAFWHACLAYLPDSAIRERQGSTSTLCDEENNQERSPDDASALVCLNRSADRLRTSSTVSAAERFNTLLDLCTWLLFGKQSLRQLQVANDLLRQAEREEWLDKANEELRAEGWDGFGDQQRLMLGALAWYCQIKDAGYLGSEEREKKSAEARWAPAEVAVVAELLFTKARQLGWYRDWGLPHDSTLSFELTHLCASMGLVEAQRALARELIERARNLTQRNRGIHDIRLGVAIYERLVDQGDLEACLELGLLLHKGECVPANHGRARKLLDQYSEQCKPDGIYRSLINYYFGCDINKAIELLRRRSEDQSGTNYLRSSCLIQLSLMEAAGVGMKADLPAALNRLESLYRKCDASNIEAFRREVNDALRRGRHIWFDLEVNTSSLLSACEQREPVLRQELFPDLVATQAQSQKVVVAVEEQASTQDSTSGESTAQTWAELESLAESGDSGAMQALGWRHVLGEGVPSNIKLGEHWLRRYCEAPDSYMSSFQPYANSGDAAASARGSAQRALDVALEFRKQSRLESTVQWLSYASERGHERATGLLAIMQSEGWGCPQNAVEAARSFALWAGQAGPLDTELLECNGPLAAFMTGSWDGDTRTELSVSNRTAMLGLKALAKAGSWKAQHMLGQVFRDGVPPFDEPLWILRYEGLPRSDSPLSPDYSEALFWFQHAANQGYAEAMLDLAKAHLAGHGTPADPAAAIRWGEAAAEAGLAEAQIWMGLQCLLSTASRSPAQAESWFEQAFNQNGKHAASIGMAFASASSEGSHDCKVAAAAWWRRGAEFGDKRSMRLWANSLITGDGVAMDEGAADRWLERKLGSPVEGDGFWIFKATELATDFLLGREAPQRPDKGVYWLRRAAEAGDNRDATLQLGLAYATGCGVPVNLEAAERWWQGCGAPEAKPLLALYWVLLRRTERYAEALSVFQSGLQQRKSFATGLADVGMGWLTRLGFHKGPHSGVYWLTRDESHWSEEVSAEHHLATRISNRTIGLAKNHLHEALRMLTKTRSEKEWFLGDAEEARIQARLKEVEAMKPKGLGRVLP